MLQQLLQLTQPTGIAKGIELVLEGGYNLTAIERSYAACVSVLLGDPPLQSPPFGSPEAPSLDALKVISKVQYSHPNNRPI